MQKYKVFFNDKRITFASRKNITISKLSFNFDDNCKVEELIIWFNSFVKNDWEDVVLYHSNPSHLFKIFKSAFIKIEAAGGVVLKNNKLLFILRKGKWDLPKGKIDKGESASESALREVTEECGIKGHSIVKQLPSTFHIYQSPYKKTKGQWIFKEAIWFEMKYEVDKSGVPQIDEGITEIRWMERNNLSEILNNTYENLVETINRYRD